MNATVTTEILTNYGMKFKLYVLKCHQHLSDKSDRRFLHKDVMKYLHMCRLSAHEYIRPKIGYDVSEQKPEDTYKELEQSKYIGYSSIMIIINENCKCRRQTLRLVIKAIKKNVFLKNKSKSIVATYYPNTFDPVDDIPKDILKRLTKLLQVNHSLYPELKKRKAYAKELMSAIETEIIKEILKDFCYFNSNKLDNLVFVQLFTHINSLTGADIDDILQGIYFYPKKSMDLVFREDDLNATRRKYRIISTSTTVNLFFYSINPALAIIINNYYFTRHGGNREGCHQDLINIVRVLKLVGIPLILLQDWNKNQLLEYFEYLKNKDFYPLKNFLFIMMSHGGSNNVVYTRDGELNINNDIIQPIQANASLKAVNKIITINACRGPISIPYADEDDFDEITATDGSHLDANTFLAFSVPNQVKSFRCQKQGSPFICLFCKYLRSMSQKDTIRNLIAKIDHELIKTSYYYGLQKCAELVTKDPTKSCNIIPTPEEASKMINLIDSLVSDIEQLSGIQDNGSSHKLITTHLVFGTLNNIKQQENPFFHKIFSTDLDNDQCNFVEE